MRKLLRADLMRLFKSNVFRILFVFMLGMGIYTAVNNYFDILEFEKAIANEELFPILPTSPVDRNIWLHALSASAGSAILSGLFIGIDYSDGTIRNKLIVGHTRVAVYLSELITGFSAALSFSAAYLATYLPLGFLMLDEAVHEPKTIVMYIVFSVFTLGAFVSIFTLIAMLIPKKSTSAVLCILLFAALFMAAVVIQSWLDIPEFVENSYSLTVNGIEQVEPYPNPRYLQPDERRVYEFIIDLLPTGQVLGLANFALKEPIRVLICALALTVVTTLAGIVSFDKKNLK